MKMERADCTGRNELERCSMLDEDRIDELREIEDDDDYWERFYADEAS